MKAVKRAVLSSVALAVFVVAGQALALTWQIETVDSAGVVGKFTSMELDSAGHPHISYWDQTNGDLKYGSWDGSAWQIEAVDSTGVAGKSTSLELDGDGNPHISYYHESSRDLRYASWDGTAWQIETVDSAGTVGKATSLVLDGANRPHIAYYSLTADELRYASWDGTAWQRETVDTGSVGRYGAIALDGLDRPQISYWDHGNGDLKYASWDGSAWQIETVDASGSVGSETSLAIDGSDHAHISYWDQTNGDLKYASWDGSTWQIETVDATGNVGGYTSIELDEADRPHISYFDFTNSDLKYALWDGGTWQIETVDATGNVGEWTSLVLDGLDRPHISYWDPVNGDLKYATADVLAPPVGPSVSVDQGVEQVDPTDVSPVLFTVVFGGPVSGFGDVAGDVVLGGTAGATTVVVTEVAPLDDTTFEVSVSGMTADGTVTVLVPAGAAFDGGGHGNRASTSTDNSVTYDVTAPETSIDDAPADPSGGNVSFEFSSTDSVGVAGFECQLDGGGFGGCLSPLSYVGLADASHTFEVRAIDNAGNVDQTPASFTWTVDTTSTNLPPECTSAGPSSGSLWPANGRLVAVQIVDVTDPESDPVTIIIDSIFQDEPVAGTGSRDRAPDGTGVGSDTARLRQERVATGNGRVYHITFTATDSHGGSCMGTVQVGVPIISGGVAVDDGALYDSTATS